MLYRKSWLVRSVLTLLLTAMSALSATVVGAQEGPMTLAGAIDDVTPYVEVPLTVDQAGSLISADLRATSGDLDTLLYLVDDTGTIIAENDDRSRTERSSLLEFPRARVGRYTVIATRYGVSDGKTQGQFALQVEVRTGASAEVPAYRVSDEALAAAGFPSLEPRPVADWTVLAYYGGDTNLESSILNDVNEFEIAGGSDDEVRVVVLLDRHPDFVTDPVGNWFSSRLFEVGPDLSKDDGIVFPPTVDTEPLADLGELDTDSGEALAQFLVWGVKHYPARRYAVALGSHGGGWQGLITDDTSDDNILSIPELRQAFTAATEATGIARFDLLINDACLMSSVEYHAATAPFFRYSLASPEVVVNPALDMTLLTEALKQNPLTIDLGALGTELVDAYITRDAPASGSVDTPWYTNAVINLDRFQPVAEAVERFAAIVNADPSAYATTLGEARARAYTYTFFIGVTTRIDLGSFMQEVVAVTDDADLAQAAEDVLAALDEARIYGNAGARAAEHVTYYNIYFPEDRNDFRSSYFDESPLPNWAAMLRNFYTRFAPQTWTGPSFVVPPGPGALKLSQGADASLTLEGEGANISHRTVTVDQLLADGRVIRLLSARLGLGAGSTFAWNGNVRVLRASGNVRSIESFSDAGGSLLYLEGRYRAPGSTQWVDVVVLFDFNGRVIRIISRNRGSDALGVLDDIPPDSEFQTYQSVVSPDGRVTLQPGATYTWPAGGLSFAEEPAPPGEYRVGVTVITFGGGVQTTFFPAEVGGEPTGSGPQGTGLPPLPTPPVPGLGSGTCSQLTLSHLSLQYYNGGIGSISVEWTPEPGAAWYRLTISGGTEYLLASQGTIIPISDLDSAGAHSIQITALDENQNAICQTDSGVFEVPVDAPIAVDPLCQGTLVVVLMDSPYAGPADLTVSADNFDGRSQDLQGRCTLAVHGNDGDNLIYGSAGSDAIFGYAGNDTIFGEAGDDFIDGGDEFCEGEGCEAGDALFGGDGNDILYGGNETCEGVGCAAGDEIHGDAGNDVIIGGDETCSPVEGECLAGDTIFGGGGDDVIEGGDGADTLFGGWDNRNGQSRDDGDDTITDSGGGSGDVIYGGNYNVAAEGMIVVGNDGNDRITDAGGDGDVIYGGNLNIAGSGVGPSASVTGHDGDDVITDNGGVGDTVHGGNSNLGFIAVVVGDDNADASGAPTGGFDTINTADGNPGDAVWGGNLNSGATGENFDDESVSITCGLGDVCDPGNEDASSN